MNTITIGKVPYTLTYPVDGGVTNYQLNKIIEKSIKSVLFFKHFKNLKMFPKKTLRPQYLLSAIKFNKKQYFVRNRRISKSRTRVFYSSGKLRLEPVILNRASFIGKKPNPKYGELTKTTLKNNALRFVKTKILLGTKLSFLKGHSYSF